MNEPTHKTYKFSTFQELVDRVPSGRIAECLREFGIVLDQGKAVVELWYLTAAELARKDGVEVPPMPEHIMDVPSELEWDDNGNGDLGCDIVNPERPGGFSIRMTRAPEPSA